MSITRRYYRTLPRWGKRLSRRFVAAYGKPAGLWLPNDVTNKAYDFSSNRNVGSLNGRITTTASGFGMLGSAWKFDGSTKYITVNSTPSLTPKVITFGVVASRTATARQVPLWKGDGSGAATDNYCFDVGAGTATTIRVGLSNGASMPFVSSTMSNINDGNPHLILATYDGANIRLYGDGNFLGSAALTGNINTATNALGVGNVGSSGGFPTLRWAGNIYIAFVFPFALSAAQVSSLYQSLLTGEPYPLFQPQIVRRGYGIRSIVGGSSFKFRRTLSDYGTRIGSRQAIG